MADVTHYSTNYMSKSNKPWIADINCYDQPQGEAGGSRIATLRFFARAPVPASGQIGSVPVVNFALARFSDVIAILRDDERIFVGHSSGGPDNIVSDGISSFNPAGRMRP
jgi:hypothetical protein